MHRLCALFLISTLSLIALVVGSQIAQAQTFTVLHAFTGGQDGDQPYAGLTLDRQGNLYGTTSGGFPGQGTVFQLKRTNGNWVLDTIDFGENFPDGRVVFGPDGSLYGTDIGGSPPPFCEFRCGSVYILRTACVGGSCRWRETTIYDFSGGADGGNPQFDPVFDQAGNLYGTAEGGGSGNDGVVFTLTSSRGRWTESVIHNFSGDDGSSPTSGVIFDSAGNLYGTTESGGVYGKGTVFRLAHFGPDWVLSTLYSFQGEADGGNPVGGVIFDQSGNLYGATPGGGSGGGGTVFELSPSGGSWNFRVLYSFNGRPGSGPQGTLAIDGDGTLYDTTSENGAFRYGSVFKLKQSDGGWTYVDLHDFTGGVATSKGAFPISGVTLDANGNVYGTTLLGGILTCGGGSGCGVVWEITP